MNDFVAVSEVAFSAPSEYSTSQPTGLLRWALPAQSAPEAKRLQQQFQIVKYKGAIADSMTYEWRDVPMELVP